MQAIAKSGSLVVLAFLLLVVTWTRAGADVSITTCGQSVPTRQIGSLQVDLTCPSSANSVFLEDRATLNLNNHTIAGSTLVCVRSCTIIGPGEVGNTPFIAILANSTGGQGTKFVAQDVTVRNSAFGIYSQALRSNQFTNVTATQNSESGIGVFAKTKGTNLTVTDNGGTGFVSQRGKVKLVGLTATGNGLGGLINNGGRTTLFNSTLTGNVDPFFPDGLDLFSFVRPRLVNTTCEHSLGPTDQPWGVCSLD
jgi:hypothetical protein